MTNIVVSSGQIELVSSGGIVGGAIVDAGGVEVVESGGSAYGTILSAGGLLVVLDGGAATDTQSAGGAATSGNAVVLETASGPVGLGASASATDIVAGGVLYVLAGGVAEATNATDLGRETVLSGGRAFGTVVSGGGFQMVWTGGLATSSVVGRLGAQLVPGGSTRATSVSAGGTEIVSSAGVAYATTVGSFGVEVVQSGGSATGTTVSAGGLLAILAGGTDTAPTMAGGFVTSGAAVVATTAGGATALGNAAAHADVAAGSTLYVFSGGTAARTQVDSGGSLVALGGFVADTTISGGTATVAAGGHVGGYVKFVAGGGVLTVVGRTLPGATISGFGAGDTIDLAGVAWARGGAAVLNAATGVLNVQEGGVAAALSLDPAHDYSGDVFSATADAGGGTEITVTCFCAGTRIATPEGETPVELLRAGDVVRLADGRDLPVRWVGRQTISRRFADPLVVVPIRIRAGALGVRLPVRDLLVSPGHALSIGGVLVQAGALAKCAGISREYAMPDKFVYYHVELDEHALLLAEGVAAESYLDGAEAFGFDNAHERRVPIRAMEMDLPRIKAARQIPAAARLRLPPRGGLSSIRLFG